MPESVTAVQVGYNITKQALKNYFLGQELCLVVDSQVADFYASDIAEWLKCYPPKRYACFIVPSGEQHKNINVFQSLFQFLLTHQFSRALNLMALGGGVVGDLTGFVAACYLRGVNFIYAPTTLLAQIDAAIGGKTGLNVAEGKNLMGVFYPAKKVICDSYFLRTLPEREFKSGLAEALKHGLVCSEPYFNWLSENAEAILQRQPEILNTLVIESIRLKATLVGQDLFDQGCRQFLNFGHTLGHALESATEYQAYLHGEAVAIGMIVAMSLSEQHLGLSTKITKSLKDLLFKFDLPINLDKLKIALSAEKIMLHLKLDKKQRAGTLRWVLLKKIGEPVLVQYNFDAQLKQILEILGARLDAK